MYDNHNRDNRLDGNYGKGIRTLIIKCLTCNRRASQGFPCEKGKLSSIPYIIKLYSNCRNVFLGITECDKSLRLKSVTVFI